MQLSTQLWVRATPEWDVHVKFTLVYLPLKGFTGLLSGFAAKARFAGEDDHL